MFLMFFFLFDQSRDRRGFPQQGLFSCFVISFTFHEPRVDMTWGCVCRGLVLTFSTSRGFLVWLIMMVGTREFVLVRRWTTSLYVDWTKISNGTSPEARKQNRSGFTQRPNGASKQTHGKHVTYPGHERWLSKMFLATQDRTSPPSSFPRMESKTKWLLPNNTNDYHGKNMPNTSCRRPEVQQNHQHNTPRVAATKSQPALTYDRLSRASGRSPDVTATTEDGRWTDTSLRNTDESV